MLIQCSVLPFCPNIWQFVPPVWSETLFVPKILFRVSNSSSFWESWLKLISRQNDNLRIGKFSLVMKSLNLANVKRPMWCVIVRHRIELILNSKSFACPLLLWSLHLQQFTYKSKIRIDPDEHPIISSDLGTFWTKTTLPSSGYNLKWIINRDFGKLWLISNILRWSR